MELVSHLGQNEQLPHCPLPFQLFTAVENENVCIQPQIINGKEIFFSPGNELIFLFLFFKPGILDFNVKYPEFCTVWYNPL